MITLSVPEMHCQKCTERISNKLATQKYVCSISLENKTVTVDIQDNDGYKIINLLNSLGFDATIIN